jgi:hypothetical protein
MIAPIGAKVKPPGIGRANKVRLEKWPRIRDEEERARPTAVPLGHIA